MSILLKLTSSVIALLVGVVVVSVVADIIGWGRYIGSGAIVLTIIYIWSRPSPLNYDISKHKKISYQKSKSLPSAKKQKESSRIITKTKSIIIILVIIIPALIAGTVGKEFAESFFNKYNTSTDVTSAIFLNKIASEINKTLPMMVDKDTLLKATIGQKGKLTYEYTLINLTSEEVAPSDITETFSKQIKKRACTTPEMAKFFDNGVTVAYSYYGKNGGYIAAISITPNDCQTYKEIMKQRSEKSYEDSVVKNEFVDDQNDSITQTNFSDEFDANQRSERMTQLYKIKDYYGVIRESQSGQYLLKTSNILGVAFFKTKQFEYANKAFITAEEFSPGSGNVKCNFGDSLLKSGNLAAALSKYCEAVQIDPSNEIYQQRVASVEQLSDYDLMAYGYSEVKVSIDFYEIDLHDVFRQFQELTDLDLIIDESVNGTLPLLVLNKVPWKLGLSVVLNMSHLTKKEVHNSIIISRE